MRIPDEIDAAQPMTITDEPVASLSPDLSSSQRVRIFAYLGGIVALVAFGDPNGGLLDVPMSFILKNQLHLAPPDVARFKLVASVPLYLSFLFGLARDTWAPSRLGDRGLIALFGCVGAVVAVGFAFVSVRVETLLLASVLLTCASLFIASAQNGLAATLGRQHRMTGEVSAVWNIFTSVPAVAAFLIGGYFSDYLEGHSVADAARALFLLNAAAMSAVALFALLRPRSVFNDVRPEHPPVLQPMRDLRTLARHRPVYPVMLIWLLWNFAPGSTTPLQYHLQNELGASDAAWGTWNAIFAGSFIPTFVAYGLLSSRFTLRQLLPWSALIAVPQFVPLLFAGSAQTAFLAAVPIGLLGGLATAAFLDLIMRAAPSGLQGTTLMLSGGLYYVSSRFGDVLGTWLYSRFGGFGICVALITAIYASVMLVLPFIPDSVFEAPGADGIVSA